MKRATKDVLYFETGPDNEPTLRVEPGEEFEVETQLKPRPMARRPPGPRGAGSETACREPLQRVHLRGRRRAWPDACGARRRDRRGPHRLHQVLGGQRGHAELAGRHWDRLSAKGRRDTGKTHPLERLAANTHRADARSGGRRAGAHALDQRLGWRVGRQLRHPGGHHRSVGLPASFRSRGAAPHRRHARPAGRRRNMRRRRHRGWRPASG